MSSRNFWQFPATALLAALVLGACASKDIDPDELPAELVGFDSTLRVDRVWSRSVGKGTDRLRLALRPATDGANIYAAAHDGRIMAFERSSGRREWSADTKMPLSAGPATDGKIVVAGSSNGDIVTLSADTGEILWVIEVTSEVLAAPVISGDTIVVRTVNGKLAAFAADDGRQLWSIQQSMPRLSVRGTSAPVTTRNLVVSGFDNGRVSAFDLADGGVVWDVLLSPPSGRTELERLVDVNSPVQVAGTDVYAVSYQGQLGSIAMESGQLIWTRDLSSHSGLAVDLSNIFVTNTRSELLSLSRASGRERWRREELRNRDVTGPAIFGQSVVVGDFEGYLHWFDVATGELQARVRAGSDRITSQPLAVDDTLYVITDGGTLYAFRLRPERNREG